MLHHFDYIAMTLSHAGLSRPNHRTSVCKQQIREEIVSSAHSQDGDKMFAEVSNLVAPLFISC